MKREATNAKRASVQAARRRGRPTKPHKPANTGDTLNDVLQDCIAVHQTAFVAYQNAACQELTSTSARLSEFNKAAQNRLEAEKSYREELERRGILVLRADIVDHCRRAIDTIARRVKKLPAEQGPQCNELEPLKAVRILQRAVDEILKAADATLHNL
jgi:glutamate-1-semialdehyde aminotransferase